MVSARSEQIDKIIGLEVGADDYITKPFDSRELMARIEAQMRRTAAVDEVPSRKMDEKSVSIDRSLRAVMFTEIIDFSEMLQKDEAHALIVLERHAESMRSLAATHKGTILKTMGARSMLLFDSAYGAIQCAEAILLSGTALNEDEDNTDRAMIRIGCHAGDVWITDGEITGETVNLAAQLQLIALPHTIYLSDSLYRTVRKRTAMKASSLGEHHLTNIRDAIHVYCLRPDTDKR
jgi:adenylate cyclase